ncbi:hypothetical protein [Streptomyces sirii]|uniref:hypothetical protein n=1 Tax=Streptomyces sirii TaxID=3127701 RepID=UPI003D36101E
MSKVDDAMSLVQQGLDKALAAQRSPARKNVERLRRVHPGDTPEELIRRLDSAYLFSVTTSGLVSGAAAAVSGGGILTAAAFTEASVLYLLSLAEVHGVHPEDFERRGRLVATVLLGGGAVRKLDRVVEHIVPYWGRRVVGAIPMGPINRANNVLRPHFVTKYGTKRGVLVLSELVPLGIGAALGAGGNHVLGRLTIKSARDTFGQPPSSWADGDRGDEAPLGPGSGNSTQ